MLVERVGAAPKCFGRERANHVGRVGQALGAQHAIHGVGQHELGAVQQGQAFFGLQHQRFPAEQTHGVGRF